MSEYVLDNGNIKLGPDSIGAVEFADGHYEPVLYVKFITKAHFHFVTPSGLYSYRADLVEEELLYCDPKPYTFLHARYEFAKYRHETDKWYCTDDIKRVYLAKRDTSEVEEVLG